MSSEVEGCAARWKGVQRGGRVCREVGGVQEGLSAANIRGAARWKGVQRGERVCSEVKGCAARWKGVQRDKKS